MAATERLGASMFERGWHAQLAGAVDGLLIIPASHAVLRAADSEEKEEEAAEAAGAPAEKGFVKI